MTRVRLRTISGEEYSPHEDRQPIECFRCGVCCIFYYPQLSPEEVERIAGDLHITSQEFISRYVQVTTIGYLLQQTDHGCVFLDWEENGKAICKIHAFRPDACRDWVPTLFRPECQDGLNKLQKSEGLISASVLYDDVEQLEQFYSSLKHIS